MCISLPYTEQFSWTIYPTQWALVFSDMPHVELYKNMLFFTRIQEENRNRIIR